MAGRGAGEEITKPKNEKSILRNDKLSLIMNRCSQLSREILANLSPCGDSAAKRPKMAEMF
jgi:hypothetical protein